MPAGLGELGHYQTAHGVQAHPFSSAAALSHSTLFAIEKIGLFQEDFMDWRKKRKRFLKSSSKELKEVSKLLLDLANSEARHPYEQCHITFVLYLCILMAHPDVTYPMGCILGFSLVGEIESPPIFRPSRPPPSSPSVEDFVSGNADRIEAIPKWVRKS